MLFASRSSSLLGKSLHRSAVASSMRKGGTSSGFVSCVWLSPASSSSSAAGAAMFSSLTTSYENIIVEQHDQVGLVKLHRPKALNALNDALMHEFLNATSEMNDKDDIGCIVVTGSSEKAFAAGADISQMSTKSFESVYQSNMFAEWQNVVSNTPNKPVIAAVSGYCLGGGCELAMMCDIMLCSENAKFGQPEIKLGVIPGAGGTQRLTRAIGKSKSMYYCLTGDFMSAKEAYESNLVAKVYKDYDELVTESINLGNRISSMGRSSVQACKEAVLAVDETSLQQGLQLERRLFHALFATNDQKEGMSAFLEKREAQFDHLKKK